MHLKRGYAKCVSSRVEPRETISRPWALGLWDGGFFYWFFLCPSIIKEENCMSVSMEQIVSHAKHRGFIFQGSEIYGGLANTWDYGPLGVELKNNVKKAWWKKFVQESPYNVGLDAAILMNPKTWEASGHLGNFNDPMIDCKNCKARHRADKLIEEKLQEKDIEMVVDGLSFDQMMNLIKEHEIKCPECGSDNFTEIRQFNLMFKTHQGVTETSANEIYLRPETAQGIFVNFKNVQRSMRKKLPFGIAQIGKSFRNEITPGNFTFRTREFEQMELEFFCKPGQELEWFNYWKEYCHKWLLSLGLTEENIRLRDHSEDELSHYSNATTDFEYKFPFGWGELWGVASRTDYDLKQHMEHSGEDFQYIDQETNERYIPYCIEPSLGADRVTLAFLLDAYEEEALEDGTSRTVMHLHPALAPFKAAVLPLSKKLSDEARAVFEDLAKHFMVDFDDAGSIGKRYRRHDEIGTPFCITFDFDSLEDKQVTIRNRDTMEQKRVPISELKAIIEEAIQF
jgi:glycyl-tRNA synthetase